MKCPKCNEKTGVIDVVHDDEVNEQLRQRKCKACGYKFWTSEVEAIETDRLKRVRFECHRSFRRKAKLKAERDAMLNNLQFRKEQKC